MVKYNGNLLSPTRVDPLAADPRSFLPSLEAEASRAEEQVKVAQKLVEDLERQLRDAHDHLQHVRIQRGRAETALAFVREMPKPQDSA